MTKTFTPNDVLRYLYEDLKPQEKSEIEEALGRDNNLMDFYLDTLETTDSMRKISKEPSDRTIENILSYSRSFILKSV